MPKKLKKYTDWTAKERLALIRRQNLDRHTSYDSKLRLQANIRRHTRNQNEEMEYDRLKAATVQGNLHAAAAARLTHLEQIFLR